MNHTEAVVAEKVQQYEDLVRMVQESQRRYNDAKRAEDHGNGSDRMVASGFYHEADQILRRRLRKALGITEVDVEFKSYEALNSR